MPIIFNILHWTSGLLLIFLSFYCFNKKTSNKIGLYLSFFLILLAGWSFSAALIFNIPGLETKIALNRVKLVCCALIPISIFFLVRSFTDKKKLSKLVLILLFIFPVISVLLLLSPFHTYFIHNYQLHPLLGSTVLTFSNGPWFNVHNYQTRILVLWSLYILMRNFFSHGPSHRKNSLFFFLSVLLPFLVDSAAVILFPSMRYLQLVPVSLTISAIILFFVIFKGNILEIVPLARNLIIDSIPDIYLVLDQSKQLVDFNKFAKNQLALDHNSYGKTLKQIHDGKNKTIAHLMEYLETSRSDYTFLQFENQNMEHYSISSEKIIGQSDAILGQILIVKNITKQKLYENQLNQIVEIRTQFIGIIAHDLIGNISGHSLFIDSLLAHPAVENNDDLKSNLSFLLRSSQDITNFVKSLLSWSKENLDKLEIKKGQVALDLLTDEAIHFLRPVSIQKNIEFICNVPSSTLTNIDSNMIQTVIRNILANAIKLSPSNSKIIIEAKKYQTFIEISICDEGPGVDEEEMNNFLTDLNIGSYKGGLGLILCRNFIHLHQGEIRVKNNTHQGATFSFTLPL